MHMSRGAGESLADLAEEVRTLRQDVEVLRTIIDESPDVIVLKDHEGNFLLGNRLVAELYGTTPEQMVGKHDGDFSATAEQAEFFRQNVLSIMASGEMEIVLEDSTDDRTGETRHFKSIKKPFIGPQGKPNILVIAHDVTDIRRSQLQIETSERRLRYVLEATGDGIWDWHIPTGKVVYSDRWVEMFGYRPEEITGDLDDFEACLHPVDGDETMAAVREALTGNGSYGREHRVRRRDGKDIWVLDRGQVVERDEAGVAVRMVGSVADISERKKAEDELAAIAYIDLLTGLPNRRFLHERLQHVLARGIRLGNYSGLFYIDLDQFKMLNDTMGHGAGDRMLQLFGERLRDCVREMDTVARFGGDEFAILVEDLGDTAEGAMMAAVAIAKKINATCDAPFDLSSISHRITASVGITVMENEGDSAEEILMRADIAMYAAKSAGRNSARFFDPDIQAALTSRIALESDLRDALLAGDIRPVYQGIVDGCGRLVGAEALARWFHPNRGVIMPTDFIGLSEQTGQILDIGRAMLRATCEQLVQWRRSPETTALTIAVNVSARQFSEPDFVDHVLAILADTGAPPERLKLELIETMLVHDIDDVIAKMALLYAEGIEILLDDFGTGYCSLSYLQRLPLTGLKIDRSFVDGIHRSEGDSAIVRTIMALASNLGLSVVAEGVETTAQHEFLREHGCEMFQGYLFSRPGPVDDLQFA